MSDLIEEDYIDDDDDYDDRDDYMLHCLTEQSIIKNNNDDDDYDDRDDYVYRLLNEYTPIKLWIHKWYSIIPFN